MAVDDLFGPRVGGVGLVLAAEDNGGLNVVDIAGSALGALELAAGPRAKIGDHLLQRLVAFEALLLVRHGVALLLGRLLAVLADLFELVLGHNVELSRYVGNGAEGKQCNDCKEEELEVVHLDEVVGLGTLVVFWVFGNCMVVFPSALLVIFHQCIYARTPPYPD